VQHDTVNVMNLETRPFFLELAIVQNTDDGVVVNSFHGKVVAVLCIYCVMELHACCVCGLFLLFTTVPIICCIST
jgi:hypothetical protein